MLGHFHTFPTFHRPFFGSNQPRTAVITTMVVASGALLSLADLAAAAGAGQEISNYLDARGIKAVATLALIAKNEESLMRNLIQPLMGTYTKGALTITLQPEEQPIAEAILRHMWQEARMWWQKRQADMAAASQAPAAPIIASAVGGVASQAAAPDKVPKSLPPGVWSQQVIKYNKITLNGRERRFPEQQLLGAESVLARIWYEHQTSKQYSPTGLGDILSRRSFTATGEVNQLAKNPKGSKVLTVEDDQLVQEEERSWSPRSVLAVMDGIMAVTWAFILLEIGEEHHLHTYAEWCIAKARSRPQKLEQFKQWWDAASWKIAMKMRAGSTFGEAAEQIMADVDLFNDHMSRDPPKESPTKKDAHKKRPAPGSHEDDAHRPTRFKGASNYKGGKGGGTPA